VRTTRRRVPAAQGAHDDAAADLRNPESSKTPEWLPTRIHEDPPYQRWQALGSTARILSLGALEFLRRFLLHVLPSGFQRIRYYGLLANCCRKGKIALCRELIGTAVIAAHTDDGVPSNSQLAAVRCPECGLGVM